MSNNKKRSELSKSQQLSLYYKVQKLVEQVNDSALPERQVAFGTALEVANRELRRNTNSAADARMYAALRAVSAFASLATKNKVTTASLQNSDFLSVGHPLSTKLHYMDEASLRHARAQWIAADSHITNEGVRSLVASAHSLEPGSLERKHAFARLAAMGPGLVPITAAVDLEPIVAAFGLGLGGNSRAARSARARMQRRDRKGRFAFQGGSWNFSVRFPDGKHRSVTGKVVGASGVDDIEVEVRDNKYVSNGVYAVPASRGIAAKATVPKSALKGLPERDVEVSAEQRKYSIESSSLKRMDSPSAWKKIQSADPNTASFMTDDGYRLDVPATDTGAPDFSGINRGKLHRAVGNQMISNSIDGWDQAEKTALMDQDNYDKYLSTPQGQKQLSQGGWGVDVVQEEITDSPFKSAFDRKAPGDRPGPVPPSVQRLVDAENERRAADEKTSAPALLDEPRGELAPTQSVSLNWQTEDGPVDQEGLDAWTQEFAPGVTAKLMDDGSVRMSGTEDNLRNAIDKATDGDYNATDYIMDSAKLESYGRPTAPVTVETPSTKKAISAPIKELEAPVKTKAPFDVDAMKKSVEGITHQKLATGPTEYEMIGDFGPAWFTEDDVYDAKKDGYRETGRQRGGNRMQTYRRYADPSGEVSDFNDATWEEKKNSIRKARANGDLLNFSYNGKNRQVQPGNVYVNKKTGGTNIVTFDHATGEERTYDVNKMKAPVPAKAKAAEAPRVVDAVSGKEPRPITSTNLQDVVGDVQKAIDGQYPINFEYGGKNRVFRPERMYTNPKTGTTNIVGFSETDGEGRTFIAEKMKPSKASQPVSDERAGAPSRPSIAPAGPEQVQKTAPGQQTLFAEPQEISPEIQRLVDAANDLRNTPTANLPAIIEQSIEEKKDVAFDFNDKLRVVTPEEIIENKTGKKQLKGFSKTDGEDRTFTIDKMNKPAPDTNVKVDDILNMPQDELDRLVDAAWPGGLTEQPGITVDEFESKYSIPFPRAVDQPDGTVGMVSKLPVAFDEGTLDDILDDFAKNFPNGKVKKTGEKSSAGWDVVEYTVPEDEIEKFGQWYRGGLTEQPQSFRQIETPASSSVEEISFDPASGELLIKFKQREGKGGGIYLYPEVDPADVSAIENADSIGSAVGKFVKGRAFEKFSGSQARDWLASKIPSSPRPTIDGNPISDYFDEEARTPRPLPQTRPEVVDTVPQVERRLNSFYDADGNLNEAGKAYNELREGTPEAIGLEGDVEDEISTFNEEAFDSMFAAPQGAYKPDVFGVYRPTGRTDQASPDYTDDPEVLANKFDPVELADAAAQGVGDGSGRGQLEFEIDKEDVPVEALLEALEKIGIDKEALLSGFYERLAAKANDPAVLDAAKTAAKDMAKAVSDDPNASEAAKLSLARAVQLNGELGAPGSTKNAEELVRGHVENNPYILKLARDIESASELDEINRMAAARIVNRYLPWAFSDDTEQQDAFRAYWGMLMLADGGDKMPWYIVDEDNFSREMALAIGEALSGTIDDGAETLEKIMDIYGDFREFANGRKRISEGVDDLSAKTTAAALYRLTAELATPSTQELQRYIFVDEGTNPFSVYTTEGIEITFDPRSFSSISVVKDPKDANETFAVFNPNRRKLIFKVPPGEIDAFDAHKYSWLPQEKEHIGYGKFKIEKVEKISNLTYTIELSRAADESTQAEDTARTVVPQSSPTVPYYGDISRWEEVAGPQGSNQGGIYEDENGRQYYVKEARSQSHAENEALASAFYRFFGIPSSEVGLATLDADRDSEPGTYNPSSTSIGSDRIVTPMIPGADDTLDDFRSDSKITSQLHDGFAIDAWLSNYDVIGQVFDNVVVDDNGNTYRIDPGGALKWRARGKLKTWFGPQVPELEDLRSYDQYPQAAAVFAAMTPEQITESGRKLLNITPSQIDDIVNSVISDLTDREMLKDILKRRRSDVLSKLGISDTTTDPFADRVPLTESIGYEAQDLQSGDVIGDDSFVIERIFRDGETPKGKVSVQGYFPGHESQRKEWNETTIIPAARGGTIPPKGDKPALHRPSAPRKPSPGAFNGKMAELLKDAKTWEEAAAVIRSTPIVYFDYETTGLPGPEKGGKNMPVQIGAVVVKDGAVVDRFNTYMNPEHELSDWSADNLKQQDGSPVTEEWLAQRPSMKVAHEQFISFVNNAVGDSVILGGQYTPFDLEILNRVLGEQGLSLDIAGTIDSKDLAQGTLPKWNSKTKIGASQVSPKDGKRRASNSLGPVADFLEVQLPDWHRADADAEASWEITDAMLNRAIENPDTTPTTLLNVDGAYAAKQKELTDYEKAYAKYEADLAEYVAAKAIAAAWNCGGSGLTAAVGAANGPCSVPDIEKMVREATPLPIGEIDPEGVEGGSTSSPTSMADAKEIDDPKHDGIDTNDPYKDEPFMPTEEQRTILDAILSGDDVVVEALAGTGKTSTLLLAGKRKKKERPTERGIYLAFNKSAQLEAERKFADAGLTNIEVATNDAISYRWAPKEIKEKMKRLSKTNPLAYYKNFAGAFGITEFEGDGGATVSLFEATKFFKDVVNKFLISADDEIGSQHFAAAGFGGDVPNWMMAIANNIWNDYKDPNGNAKINNTVVTKMWALSKPDLSKIGSGTKYENTFIFFDEAQDINPVSGRVIGEQQLQVVYVGDNNQAIYAFRGGENQLEKVDRAVRRLPLTKSFRFGENIAKEANKWLQLLGTDLRVIGAGSDPGMVVPTGSMLDTTNAILVRTNGGGFSAIADQLGRGRKVGVTKNYKGDLVSLTDTAEYLITGNNKPSQLHEDLAPFKAWPEVQKAIEDDLIDSKKLEIFAQMIDAEGIPGIREMINQLRLVKGSGEISDRSEDDTQVDIGDVAPGASGELGKGITYTVTESAVALSGNTYANKDAIKGTNRFKYNGATKTWDAPSTNEADTFDLLNGLSSALGLKTADPEAPDDGKIDVMVTTVHQAKGLEWDSVVAWDDFWGPRVNRETGEVEMPQPTELKIAYVAVTRAKKQVDLGPLNWIDSFVKPDAPAEEEVSAPAQEPTAEGEGGGGIEVPPAPTPAPAEGEDDNERIVKSVKQAVKDADALLEEYADRSSKDEKNIKKFREAVKDALFAYDGELYVDTEEKFREAAEFLEPYAEVGAGDLQSLMLQAADAADAVRISKLTPAEAPAPRPKLDPEWRPDDVAAPQGAMPTGVAEAPDSVLPDADAPKTAQQEAEEKNKAFRSDANKAADLQQKFDEFNEAVELVTGEDTSLKTSDRKRVRDAAAKVDAIRKALADGSVSEQSALAQLNAILDEFPHKPADSAIAIDINFFRDMLEGISEVLTGQYYWRPTGKSLPPLDAVDSTGRPVGYSRDGKTFITPGMRVRDKWGYSGTVEGYNEKDWINVFIRYDIDPRNPADVKKGNWGPGVARKSMNPSTLTVLSPEDDTDPWIDLPSTPASKRLPTEILEKQKKDWAKLKAARDYEAAARAAELKGEEAPPMPAGLALMTPSADLVRDSKKTKANISSYFDDSYDDQDVADATNDFSLSKNEQFVASDAVITTTDSNGVPMVLMISREYGPFKGAHALPGGFRDGGESFEATADREMMEEVGISADQATSRRYLGEVDSNDWDPRAYKGAYVGAVAYEVPMDTPLAAGDDATGARWVSIPDIIKGFTPVAFGHATWLAEAYKGTKYEAPLRALVKASKERNARLISQINAIREQKGFPTFGTPTLEVWTPVYPEGGGEQGGDLPKADAPSGAPAADEELAEELGDEISAPDDARNEVLNNAPDDEILLRLLTEGGSSDKNVKFNESWADHIASYQNDAPAASYFRLIADTLSSFDGERIDFDDEAVIQNLVDKKILGLRDPEAENVLEKYYTPALGQLAWGVHVWTDGTLLNKDPQEAVQDMKERLIVDTGDNGYMSPAWFTSPTETKTVAEFWTAYAKILDDPSVLKTDIPLGASPAGILMRVLREAGTLNGTFARVLSFKQSIDDESHPLNYMLNTGQPVTLRPASWAPYSGNITSAYDVFGYEGWGQDPDNLGDVLITVENPKGLDVRPLANLYGEDEFILTNGRYVVKSVEKKKLGEATYTHFTIEKTADAPQGAPVAQAPATDIGFDQVENSYKSAGFTSESTGLPSEGLIDYITYGTEDINGYLRAEKEGDSTWEPEGAGQDEIEKYVKQIDNIIDEAPTFDAPVTVYRGTVSKKDKVPKEGETTANPEYLSTSLSPFVAEDFTRLDRHFSKNDIDKGYAKDTVPVIYEIEISPGEKFLSVPHFLPGIDSTLAENEEFADKDWAAEGKNGQQEIIIARDSEIKVLEVTTRNDGAILVKASLAKKAKAQNDTDEYSEVQPIDDVGSFLSKIEKQYKKPDGIGMADIDFDDDAMAFAQYRSGIASAVNSALSSGQIGGMQETINRLDRFIDRAPTIDDDMLVFRGINSTYTGADAFRTMQPGEVFVSPTYTSASLLERVASDFATKGGGDGMIIEIVIPKDNKIKGIYTDPFAGVEIVGNEYDEEFINNTEAELVLPRDMRFSVVSNDGKRLRVVAVGPDQLERFKDLRETLGQPDENSVDKYPEVEFSEFVALAKDYMQKGKVAYETKKLTKKDWARIQSYFGFDSIAINSSLREGKKLWLADSNDTVENAITSIDKVFEAAAAELPNNSTVFRGVVRRQGDFLKSLKPGDTFVDKGYMSTSISSDLARKFTNTDEQATILRIEVPAGTKVIPNYIAVQAGQETAEKEFLLPRGLRFEVTSIEEADTPNKEYEFLPQKYTVVSVRAVPQRFEYTIGKSYWNFFVANGGLTTLEGVFDSKDQAFYEVNTGSVPKASVKVRLNQKEFVSLYEKVQNDRSLYDEGSDSSSISAAVYKSLLATQSTLELLDSPNYRAKFEPDNSEENAATLGNNVATPDLREEGRGAAPDGTPNDNELIEMFLDGLENPASEFVSRWAAGFSKYERGSDPEAESVADVLNGGMSLLKFDELTKDNEFAQNLYAGVTIFTISYASNAQSMQGIPDIRTDWSLKNKPTLLDPTNVGARSFWYDVAKYLYSPELLDGPITPASALLRAVRAAKPLNKTFERFLKFDELPITDQDHPFNGLLAVGQEIELRPASWTLAENLGVLEMVQDARTVGSPSNPDDVKASQGNGHVVLRVEGVSALDISNISQIPEELEHIVSNGKYVVSNVEEIFDENVSFEDSFTRYIRVTLSPVLSEQAPTPKPEYDPSDISTWPSELLDDEGITDPRAALNIIDTAFALLFDPKSTSKADERAGALYFATMDAIRKGISTIERKIEEANLRGKSYLDVPGSQTNMKALNEIRNSLGTEMETSTVFSNYYYGAEKYAQDQSDPDSSPSIADTLAQMDALRQRPSRWAKKQSNFRKGSAKLASGAISSPGAITPAGRPPVVTSNPLPLTSSGFNEIMSLSSAIEIVRNKKENDGILGASALVDSTDIEDLDVHVNLINDLEDGEKKLRLRFKLTPWAMLRKQTELADSKEKTWSKSQYVLRRTSLTDTGEIEVHGKAANPIGVYDRAGAEWTYLSEDVGGKADIRIVVANIADLSMDLETNYSSGAPASFHGQVTIDLKLDSTLEDVADALRLAGVGDVRSAERADVDVFIENRLISLFYSQNKSHINVKGQAHREFLLDQLYKKWGVKAEDITLSTGAHGRVDYVFPDAVARKIADSIDTTHFVHNISLVKVIDEVLDAYRYPPGFGSGPRAGLQDSYGRGQTPEAAVIDAVSSAIAAILKRGLLSTVTRFNEGLPYKGMSTSEDIYTGGADSSFLTPRESLDGVEPFKSGTEYLGTGTVLFDPMNVIRRTDIYANTYDSYGKRIEGSNTLRNLQPNNYETLVRHGIDVVAPGNNIILNGKIRERILDMFAEEGITEINGVRLEDFMIADTPLIREPNEYSAEVAADLAEVIKDAGGSVSAVTYKELSALMQLSGAPFMYPYMPPNSTIVAISYDASGAADTSPEEDDNLDIAQVPRLYVLHPNGTAYAVEGARVGNSGGMLLIDRSELDDLAENLSSNKLSPILQKTGNTFLNKTGSYDTNWTGKITIPAGQPSAGVDVEYKKSPKSYDEYAEYIDSVYKEIEEDVTNNPTLATEAAYLKMFSSLMTLYVSDIGGIADKNGRSLRGLITSRLLDIRNHILKYPQDTPVVSSIDTQELWPVDYDRFMLDGNYVNTLRGNVVIEELDGENAGNIRPVNYVGVIPKVDDLTVVSTQVLIETNRQGRGQYDLDPGTSLVIDPRTRAMQFSSRGIRYIVRALRPSNKKQTQERA